MLITLYVEYTETIGIKFKQCKKYIAKILFRNIYNKYRSKNQFTILRHS